jgi:amidohydrolase
MTHPVKKSLAILLAWLVLLALPARGVDKLTSLRIKREIRRIENDVLQIRRFLHMNPELSAEEYETTKLIATKLLSLNLELQTSEARTGVAGLLRGESPGLTIAFVVPINAQSFDEKNTLPYRSLNPGVMHACGNDVHMAIAIGTAMVLSSLKDKISGNIKFVFQPGARTSENNEPGAKLMIQQGVLDQPPVGAALSLQIWPLELGKIYFSSGTVLSGEEEITMIIQSKRASLAPPEAPDLIAATSWLINSFHQIAAREIPRTDPYLIYLGKIHGGLNFRHSPQKIMVEGIIRYLNPATRTTLHRILEELSSNMADLLHVQPQLIWKPKIPPLYNHPELVEILEPSLIQLLGKENIIHSSPLLFTHDFSFYSQKIPAFLLFLGASSSRREQNFSYLPHPGFIPSEKSIPLGIEIISHLLLDCLAKPTISSSYP